jgi:hypothetical protein
MSLGLSNTKKVENKTNADGQKITAANVVYCFLPCTCGMLTQPKRADKVDPRSVLLVIAASARTIPLSKVFQQRPASTSDIVPVLKEVADLVAVLRPVIHDLSLPCLKRTSLGCSSEMVGPW